MNIVIVGQGAIGLLWYHQLVENKKNNVTLLCSKRLKEASAQTYFTNTENQTRETPLALVTDNDIHQAELILVCVKSYHLASALIPISEQINPCAALVFCHNGMVDLKSLPSLTQPCYTLLTTHGAKIIKPFHVQHTGVGHNDLGLVSGNIAVEHENSMMSILEQALPSLALSDDIKKKQWQKLAINSVINPITALDNINNGEVVNEKYIVLIDQLLKEIILVATYENVVFNFQELKAKVLNVALMTAKNCSSMRSDILQQRRTEIDYINGYIVSLSKKAGIAVPENERLLQEVKALEELKH